MGLLILDQKIEGNVALDAAGNADEAHPVGGGPPRGSQTPILERHVGVDDDHPGQIAQGIARIGSALQGAEHQFQQPIRPHRALPGTNLEATVRVANEKQAGAKQIDTLGRHQAAHHRPGAQRERKFRDTGDHLAVGIDGAHVEDANIQGAFPTGPGQNGVVEADAERLRVGRQNALDIRRKEGERNRTQSQPPGEQDCQDRQARRQAADQLKQGAKGPCHHAILPFLDRGLTAVRRSRSLRQIGVIENARFRPGLRAGKSSRRRQRRTCPNGNRTLARERREHRRSRIGPLRRRVPRPSRRSAA